MADVRVAFEWRACSECTLTFWERTSISEHFGKEYWMSLIEMVSERGKLLGDGEKWEARRGGRGKLGWKCRGGDAGESRGVWRDSSLPWA